MKQLNSANEAKVKKKTIDKT